MVLRPLNCITHWERRVWIVTVGECAIPIRDYPEHRIFQKLTLHVENNIELTAENTGSPIDNVFLVRKTPFAPRVFIPCR